MRSPSRPNGPVLTRARSVRRSTPESFSMTMLAAGSHVPAFTLASDAARTVTTEGLRGSWFVLYFYPRADTPGCTREAQAFTAQYESFAAIGVKVFGISKDSVSALCKFRDKYALSVELLSDPDLAVHKGFGAFGEKMMYGKRVEGVIRSTFVVNPEGVVAHVFPNVKVDGHAEKVLESLHLLQAGKPVSTSTRKAPRAG